MTREAVQLQSQGAAQSSPGVSSDLRALQDQRRAPGHGSLGDRSSFEHFLALGKNFFFLYINKLYFLMQF